MWMFWILFANGGIMWLENVYRNGSYPSFAHALPYIFIPVLIGQVGLFYGFRGAPNLLVAGATFTILNVVLRIVNSYLLGEVPNLYQWAGVALLIVSTFLLKVK